MATKIGLITDIHYNDADDVVGPSGPGDDVEYRRYSNAQARVTAAAAQFETSAVDVVIALGDILDGAHTAPATGYADFIIDLEAEWSGDHYAIVGNHDADIENIATWAANIANTTGSNSYAAIWSDGGMDYSFAFKIDDIWFISVYNNTGANWTAQESAIETFITNLAGAPYVVLAHEPFFDSGDTLKMTEHAAAKTLFESYGNCQCVFNGHRHYPVANTIVNDIQYYPLRGSLLSPTEGDTSKNAYYVINIVDTAVYTANGMKPNVEITGYNMGATTAYTNYACI